MRHTCCFSVFLVLLMTIIHLISAQNNTIKNDNNNSTASINSRGLTSCPETEEWSECASHCPPHCPIFNPQTGQLDNGTSSPCILSCRLGCQCKTGLVRDLRQGNRCVPPESCTPINWSRDSCGPNQVFEECGTACPNLCPYIDTESGQWMDGSQPRVCTKQCVVGCACKCGFLRDPKQNGACVHREQCLDP